MSRATRWGLVLALVTASGACESVTVVVEEVATVQLQPSTLSLEEGESALLSAVPRSAGGQALSGRAITWTTLSPLVVSVDGEGRATAEGPGEGTVRATAGGVSGEAIIIVTRGAAVALDRDQVTVRAEAGTVSGTEMVQVTNGGGGTLTGLSVVVDYPDEEPGGWLSAGLGGTAAPTTLDLTGSATALGPGSYEALVTVRGASAGDRAASVRVFFDVDPASPAIVLDADAVALAAVQGGQEPAVQTVGVSNGGAGLLTGLLLEVVYADGEPVGWLDASLLATTAPTSIVVSAAPDGLVPGVYHAEVTVTSLVAVDPSVLEVTFTVAPASAPRSDR